MTKFIDLNKLKGKKPNFSSKQKTLIMRVGLMTLLIALLAGAVALNGHMNAQVELDPQEVAAAIRSTKPSPTVPAAAMPTAKGQAVSAPATGSAAAGVNYFENFRTDRARLREKQIAMLDEVIAASAGNNAAQEAGEEKIEITARMEAEFAIEKVLLAKGYAEAVCIVRDDNATVAIKKMKLTETDTAIILAAVMDATDLSPDEIKVIAAAS